MTRHGILNTPGVDKLAIAVEESARAANISNPRFVEPARGTLDRAKSRRHHIVFGRRGSGKTSLLAKAAADLTVDRRPIAFVNLETFKGHSYPDVLLSVLIETLDNFKKWFDTAAVNPASKTTFWKRLFGAPPSRPPLRRAEVQPIIEAIDTQSKELRKQLFVPESAAVVTTTEQSREAGTADGVKTAVIAGPVAVGASADSTTRSASSSRVVEESRRQKIDFLHRWLIEFQGLFRRVAEVSDGDAFLFLDDLYHIRRLDQPNVIDYFHRIAKGSRLWIKIGTIRHRTDWYRHSDPPIGLKLGDDSEEIDLDLTLEKYDLARDFLLSVLSDIATRAGVPNVRSLLAPTAINRLVLASGGVARDFLALFRKSIEIARERGAGPRGPRIVAQDVNQAAGEHDAAKRDELKRDTLEERAQVERAFDAVRKFCIETANCNCLLIEKDRTDPGAALMEELVDLRMLHLVQSRVTISDRPGKLFVAYMLDLGQYTGERKRRALEMVPFWTRRAKDRLRRVGLIFDPPQPTARSEA